MIAGVYARKSTDQHGVADEAKSITRQITGARRGYRFTGAIALDRLVAGILDLPQKTRGELASPAGTASSWTFESTRRLTRAA
jgi:hypothetical protein